MSVELIMPKAGLTMIEGTVGRWKAEEGAFVKKDEPILEIENEKTTMDVEAKTDGYLHIAAKTGDVVAVGGVIGYLMETEEEYAAFSAGKGAAAQGKGKGSGDDSEPGHSGHCGQAETKKSMEAKNGGGGSASGRRVRATGLAKKMAAQEGIELSQIRGSGPGDRIMAKDVGEFLAMDRQGGAFCQTTQGLGEIKKIPLSGIRRTIARNMKNSLLDMAQASAAVEVDATALLALHGRLRAKAELTGCRITVNDLLAKATVEMLKKHPLANATFDGTEISSYTSVNLAIAVGAEAGLMVPVVKNADEMSLTQLSRAIRDLAETARAGKLADGQQSGGTFTITNVGMYPIDLGTPVVNSPQVAIAGFGRCSKKPVVRNDEICIRDMINVFFTFDHRVFDGLEVGRILIDLKEYIEHPELMLI